MPSPPPIRTLLVDDEYPALQLLQSFLENVPDIEIVGATQSPLEALELLRRQHVDLLFLDIQMPHLKGNALVKALRRPPLVVFTTAYADYAVEAFELEAVDYLVKPYSLERLLLALDRVRARRGIAPPAQNNSLSANDASPSANTHLVVKSDGQWRRIPLADILYIEGLREYVRLVTRRGRYVVLERMHQLEQALPADRFIRTHKSWIVAIGQVEALEGNCLVLGEHRIPVSRNRRDEVVRRIFGQEL